MNELLDTERVYVEELLCVLEVSLQGWGDGQGAPGPVGPPAPCSKGERMVAALLARPHRREQGQGD